MVMLKEAKTEPRVGSRRLVVFVPETLHNSAEFARKVYLAAVVQQREVFYLALNRWEAGSLAAARQLATLTALTQDRAISASALQVEADDWIDALRQLARPGDMVVWPEERLLAPPRLVKELGITQQVLPGAYAPAPRSRTWQRTLLFWLAALAIFALFSFLELNLQGLMTGAPYKTALILLFGLECAALYQWNRLFR